MWEKLLIPKTKFTLRDLIDIMTLPLINWPWSKQIKVRCNDGSIRYYYKNIDDIYPLESMNKTKQIEIASNYAKQLEVEIGVANTSQLLGFFSALFDAANRNFILDLRAAYCRYREDPCGMAEWYSSTTKEIIMSQEQLIEPLLKFELETGNLFLSQTVKISELKHLLNDIKKNLTAIYQLSNDQTTLSVVASEMQEINRLVKKWEGTE